MPTPDVAVKKRKIWEVCTMRIVAIGKMLAETGMRCGKVRKLQTMRSNMQS